MATDSHSEYRFEGYVLDTLSGKVRTAEGTVLALSSRAFSVLRILVERGGETLSKAELMDAAWPGLVVEENNLNQAICSLRKALDDSKSKGRFIQTIPGRGYRFSAAVVVAEGVSPAVKAPTDEVAASDAPAPSPPASASASAFDSVSAPTRVQRNWRAWLPLAAALALVIPVLSLVSALPLFNGENAASSEAEMDSFPESTAGSPPLIRNSVAVLPFTLLNSAEGDELFAFGLHDEIINQLAKIRSLNVIARNSIVTLTRDKPSIEDIGRQLGVESVISGSIMFVGEQARVSLQMLEPLNGVVLWAATYETNPGKLDELIPLHSDIALNVSEALEVEVNSRERKALESVPTTSFAAYRYHLAATAAYYDLDYASAWELSRQAITLDPEFYDALYIFASVNTVLVGTPFPDKDSRQHSAMAMETAKRMIRIQPERTEGHALKAAVHSTNREWLEVGEEIEILRGMNASLSDMRFLAAVLLCLGDFEGAIQILEANLRVEPVNLYARGFLMMAHELAGQRLRARQEYELGETLTPRWWGDTVEIFLALGRGEPLPDIAEQQGMSKRLQSLLHHVNAGRLDEVDLALQEYRESASKTQVESLFHSAVAAYAGQPELSLELLHHALHDVWLSIHWVWLPVYDEVRRLEGFKDLLAESGIPAYWEKFGWPALCEPARGSYECKWQAYP